MRVDAALHRLNPRVPKRDFLLVGFVHQVFQLHAHAGKRAAQLPQLVVSVHGHGNAQLAPADAHGRVAKQADGPNDAPVDKRHHQKADRREKRKHPYHNGPEGFHLAVHRALVRLNLKAERIVARGLVQRVQKRPALLAHARRHAQMRPVSKDILIQPDQVFHAQSLARLACGHKKPLRA